MTELIQALVFGVLTGGVYALMATGLTLTFGVMKIVNLAQGAFLILSAYLCYTLWAHLGIDPLLGSLIVVVPLAVLGGIGNGYAGACLSTLVMTRTPESARGRVSATANAMFGGAQGVSLLLGGALATVLAPREIYAVAGLLGLAAVLVVGIAILPRTSRPATRLFRIARGNPIAGDG